jgi:hypothetical protein
MPMVLLADGVKQLSLAKGVSGLILKQKLVAVESAVAVRVTWPLVGGLILMPVMAGAVLLLSGLTPLLFCAPSSLPPQAASKETSNVLYIHFMSKTSI